MRPNEESSANFCFFFSTRSLSARFSRQRDGELFRVHLSVNRFLNELQKPAESSAHFNATRNSFTFFFS